MRRKVLVCSASMGAGHDGVARELASRLAAQGHEARIIDIFEMPPLGLGALARFISEFQYRHAPWLYTFLYRLYYLFPFLAPAQTMFISLLGRHGLTREIREAEPDVIVSVHPFGSLVLGRMRKKHWLEVPVVNYITDFAVHPMTVHPYLDLNLAVSPPAGKTAHDRSYGLETRAPGAFVNERFFIPRTDRALTRASLGLVGDQRAVLVVAGAWGVGDVIDTARALHRTGRFHPVTACGRNEKLRRKLVRRGLGTALGWTDQMPALMGAVDALVENAGGLSAEEAFAAGLPVVSYKAIPGHGRENAALMQEYGVSRRAHNDRELREILETLTTPGPERDAQIAKARSLFVSDPTEDVLEVAERYAPKLAEVLPLHQPRGPRRVAITAASVVAVYAALTIGAQSVSAMGVGVAGAPRSIRNVTYVGVRLASNELASRRVRSELSRLHATAVVDGQTVEASGRTIEQLADRGVDIANAGCGSHGSLIRYYRARNDVARTDDLIRRKTGVKPKTFAPMRELDGFDYYWARRHHERLVNPKVVRPESLPKQLVERRVYVIDGRERSAHSIANALSTLRAQARRSDLRVLPLSELK